jgi:hypothetical protein
MQFHWSFVLTSRLNGVSIPPIGQAQQQDQEGDLMRFGVFSRIALHTIPEPRKWAVDVSAEELDRMEESGY